MGSRGSDFHWNKIGLKLGNMGSGSACESCLYGTHLGWTDGECLGLRVLQGLKHGDLVTRQGVLQEPSMDSLPTWHGGLICLHIS